MEEDKNRIVTLDGKTQAEVDAIYKENIKVWERIDKLAQYISENNLTLEDFAREMLEKSKQESREQETPKK